MDIAYDELTPQSRRIRLNGRLDLKGTGEIEARFASLTGSDSRNILVDMSGVDFLASIGMRLLLTNAKAKARQGGKMVLVAPKAMVWEALETAGLDTLIPIYADEAAALAGLSA